MNTRVAYSHAKQAVKASETSFANSTAQTLLRVYATDLTTDESRLFLRFVLLAWDFWTGRTSGEVGQSNK